MEKILNGLELNCEGCPALPLRTEQQLKRIDHWRRLRLLQLEAMGEPKVILLGESFPKGRYIYDLSTSYGNTGLRQMLKEELYDADMTDEIFLSTLEDDKILIVDCAYCPLHVKEAGDAALTNAQKRKAATICLQRHNMELIHWYPNARIITIFPWKRGFLKKELPEMEKRITAMFAFTALRGLKDEVKKV